MVSISLLTYTLIREGESIFTSLNLDFSVEDSKYSVIQNTIPQIFIEYYLCVRKCTRYFECFLLRMVKIHEYSNKSHKTQVLF